jgi:hypothetical protein
VVALRTGQGTGVQAWRVIRLATTRWVTHYRVGALSGPPPRPQGWEVGLQWQSSYSLAGSAWWLSLLNSCVQSSSQPLLPASELKLGSEGILFIHPDIKVRAF